MSPGPRKSKKSRYMTSPAATRAGSSNMKPAAIGSRSWTKLPWRNRRRCRKTAAVSATSAISTTLGEAARASVKLFRPRTGLAPEEQGSAGQRGGQIVSGGDPLIEDRQLFFPVLRREALLAQPHAEGGPHRFDLRQRLALPGGFES